MEWGGLHKLSKRGYVRLSLKMGVGKKEDTLLKRGEGARYLYYLEYKLDIGILKILAKLELIHSLNLLSFFLPDYNICSLTRNSENCWQCRAAFLTELFW